MLALGAGWLGVLPLTLISISGLLVADCGAEELVGEVISIGSPGEGAEVSMMGTVLAPFIGSSGIAVSGRSAGRVCGTGSVLAAIWSEKFLTVSFIKRGTYPVCLKDWKEALGESGSPVALASSQAASSREPHVVRAAEVSRSQPSHDHSHMLPSLREASGCPVITPSLSISPPGSPHTSSPALDTQLRYARVACVRKEAQKSLLIKIRSSRLL